MNERNPGLAPARAARPCWMVSHAYNITIDPAGVLKDLTYYL